MNPTQLDFFQTSLAAQFEEWSHTAGGRHVMRDLYRRAAAYGARFKRTGRRVSVKLLWEIERDHITEVRRRLKRHNIPLAKYEGYALNNVFTAYVARHLQSHRPDWAGMFELRAIDRDPPPRHVIVIPEKRRHIS